MWMLIQFRRNVTCVIKRIKNKVQKYKYLADILIYYIHNYTIIYLSFNDPYFIYELSG